MIIKKIFNSVSLKKNNNFELARKTIQETNIKDRINMPKIYNECSQDEKQFINIFMKKFKKYEKEIIYNKKSGYINFCYKNMQIGRIKLNEKVRKMQILTIYGVEWKDNISLTDAIESLDRWNEYLEKIISITQ